MFSRLHAVGWTDLQCVHEVHPCLGIIQVSCGQPTLTVVSVMSALFAQSVSEQNAWVKATVGLIDFLNSRADAGGAFTAELERFREACTQINLSLGSAVTTTGDLSRHASYDLTDKIGQSTEAISERMVRSATTKRWRSTVLFDDSFVLVFVTIIVSQSDISRKMDVLMNRSLDVAKGHQERQLKRFEESALSSEQREEAAVELESDREIINRAGCV